MDSARLGRKLSPGSRFQFHSSSKRFDRSQTDNLLQGNLPSVTSPCGTLEPVCEPILYEFSGSTKFALAQRIQFDQFNAKIPCCHNFTNDTFKRAKLMLQSRDFLRFQFHAKPFHDFVPYSLLNDCACQVQSHTSNKKLMDVFGNCLGLTNNDMFPDRPLLVFSKDGALSGIKTFVPAPDVSNSNPKELINNEFDAVYADPVRFLLSQDVQLANSQVLGIETSYYLESEPTLVTVRSAQNLLLGEISDNVVNFFQVLDFSQNRVIEDVKINPLCPEECLAVFGERQIYSLRPIHQSSYGVDREFKIDSNSVLAHSKLLSYCASPRCFFLANGEKLNKYDLRSPGFVSTMNLQTEWRIPKLSQGLTSITRLSQTPFCQVFGMEGHILLADERKISEPILEWTIPAVRGAPNLITSDSGKWDRGIIVIGSMHLSGLSSVCYDNFYASDVRAGDHLSVFPGRDMKTSVSTIDHLSTFPFHDLAIPSLYGLKIYRDEESQFTLYHLSVTGYLLQQTFRIESTSKAKGCSGDMSISSLWNSMKLPDKKLYSSGLIPELLKLKRTIDVYIDFNPEFLSFPSRNSCDEFSLPSRHTILYLEATLYHPCSLFQLGYQSGTDEALSTLETMKNNASKLIEYRIKSFSSCISGSDDEFVAEIIRLSSTMFYQIPISVSMDKSEEVNSLDFQEDEFPEDDMISLKALWFSLQ